MKERLKWAAGKVATFGASPWVWGSVVLVTAIGIGFGIGAWRNLCADCPSIARIHTWEPQQTTKVYSADGQLIAELGQERRTAVPITALPPHVAQAFVAIEDGRFYEHRGFDPRGIARAVVSRLLPRSLVRSVTGVTLRTGGASTITQQLARDIFRAEVGSARSGVDGILRKLKELQVAIEIERAYTKDQILEAYMNQINFDRAWYGLQTASRNYFGKDAVDLNPAEAAMLAAIVNRPAYYNPIRNPEEGLFRRNLVLDRMAVEGFLSEAEVAQWKEFPIPTERALVSEGSAPYFVEMVRQELEQRFGSQLYTGGYRVETTLDLATQRAAELAMDRAWDRIENNPGFRYPRYAEYAEQTEPFQSPNSPYVQGAFVAMDPVTGGIRALVGGRDFNHSKFNRVTQALRQPGSSFKSFVYASALAQGIPASRVIVDRMYQWNDPSTGELWSPRNFEGEFAGPVTLREAYRRSLNATTVWLADDVGLETIAQTAQTFGIGTPIPRVPSMAIGSAEVRPIEITEAYSVFATLGTRVQPIAITRVLDSAGEVVWEPESTRTRVFDPLVSRLMVTLMEDVVDEGSGAAIRGEVGLPRSMVPAAGKTGTTNSSTDLWFVGFTPNLLATVWFGFDEPHALYQGATSGEATRAWGWFMKEVYMGNAFLCGVQACDGEEPEPADPLLPFPAPWSLAGLSQVTIDTRTGLRASQWCPFDRRDTEYYLPGTEPQEFCDESVDLGGRAGNRFGF